MVMAKATALACFGSCGTSASRHDALQALRCSTVSAYARQRFLAAALCSGLAALLAWFGVINAWQFTTADTVMHLGWGTGAPWALAYAVVTALLLVARVLPRQADGACEP